MIAHTTSDGPAPPQPQERVSCSHPFAEYRAQQCARFVRVCRDFGL